MNVLQQQLQVAQQRLSQEQIAREQEAQAIQQQLIREQAIRQQLEAELAQLKSVYEREANINSSTNRNNYITGNRFYIEMESTLTASFSECSGFGVNLKKEAYLEGGVNDLQRIVVGHAEFDDITLKRGMSDSQTFWNWITNTLTSLEKERRNVNIVLFNQAGETMQCWTLIGSIPISWKAPAFQADSSSMAIEELTLAYEGLQLTQTSGAGASIVQRDDSGFFAPN
ncbi:phage tail protein [Pleurocapsales cyanobacterium LEGE 10410]|nr:phage tail protein [Pleurocapsales cyanobacterium LEGE 10410]